MNELYTLLNDLETDVPPVDEVTLARITQKARRKLRKRSSRRGGKHLAEGHGIRLHLTRGAAALLAALVLVTAAVAAAIPLWNAFFGGLSRRQQEIVGELEIGGEEAEKTEQAEQNTAPEEDSLLPPPVEHDGVTVTPLRILGSQNQLYLVLEIRAPEGTVFQPEDKLTLSGGLRPSEKWWAEHPKEFGGASGRSTVLEAGTREPNVAVIVAEETTSFDVGGSTFKVWSLERKTADREYETIFEAEDPKTGSWDIPIPEELNTKQVRQLPVEGMVMTQGNKHMTLLSMSVSPLGVWWQYQLEGEDPWPQVRIALRMKDGTEIEADPGQLTMGDFGSGLTGSVRFEKPVDLDQAEAVLWEDVVIPLEQP